MNSLPILNVLLWGVLAAMLVLTDLSLNGVQRILVAVSLGALVGAGAAALGVSVAGQIWGFLGATAVLAIILEILRMRRRWKARQEEQAHGH